MGIVSLTIFNIKYLQFETYLEYNEAHISISSLIISECVLIRSQID